MKRISRIILFILLLGCAAFSNADRRPIIGISDTHRDATNAVVPRSYVDAVLMTGGVPVVIPLMYDDAEMIELLNSLDGIIFTGGEDFDPAFYNERAIPQMGRINAPRDKFDLTLVRLAAERSIPILGICRGMQLINIAFGGSLYQDLPAQYSDKSIRHRQSQASTEATHQVIIEDNTFFADIVKESTLMVNSAHHQAAKDVAKGFRVAGRSTDKVVEVIEKIDDDSWILGVQFHPEMRVTRDNAMRRIFQRFIEEAGNQSKSMRSDRQVTVSRQQIERELLRELNIKATASATSQPIVQSVIDTQYVYRFVRDTIIVTMPAKTVFMPADTVYVSVPDTKVVYKTDTVYLTASAPTVRDTVYITVSPPTVKDTVTLTVSAPIILDTVKPSLKDMAVTETVSQTDSAKAVLEQVIAQPVQSFEIIENKPVILTPDTLIFTPGEATVPVKKKPATSSKNEAKVKAKEQKEKEKFEKKLAKAKEKQFRQLQKENAKLDKKELKIRKKQGTAEKE